MRESLVTHVTGKKAKFKRSLAAGSKMMMLTIPYAVKHTLNDRSEVKDSYGMRLRVRVLDLRVFLSKRVGMRGARKGVGGVGDIVEAARSLTRFSTMKCGVLRSNSIKMR